MKRQSTRLKAVICILSLSAFLYACDGSSGNDGVAALFITDAEKIVGNIVTNARASKEFFKDVESAANIVSAANVVNEASCKDGGVIVWDVGGKVEAPLILDLSVEAIDCKEDGVISNGRMIFNFSEAEEFIKISFPDGFFIMTQEGKRSEIESGGFFKTQNEGGYLVTTTHLIVNDGNDRIGSENLVYKIKEGDYGGVEYFPFSGMESVGDLNLKIDTNYDASVTPMVIGGDEDLQIGGLFRYVDSAGKKIEAEATAINKVTVRIDKNGNGEFEEGESTVVSIMDDGLQTGTGAGLTDDEYNDALTNASYTSAIMFANNMHAMNMSLW
ncbi:MAG TPA: hypothetical protein ENI94_04170 [Gammaproteobacteria bacterium]|nr:hypothetical protein [Gammaproteobacteria bacterium]